MLKNIKGFSLIEILVTIGLLAIVMIGILKVFILCSFQTNLAGNLSSAMTEVQNKLEEIRNYTYDNIVTDYSSGGTKGNTFSLTLVTGKGIIYIDNSNSSLLKIKITASWKNKNNRIVGEDLDLDGVLDSGEDANGNGQLDSPAFVETYLSKKT